MSSESARSTINSEQAFVANPGLVSRRIGDEMILVPVSSKVGDLDAIYTLTDVGARIWALLREPVTVWQIAAVLCEEYDVAAAVARTDTVEFLDQLIAKQLINVVSEV